jgi:hypothetical protein
MDDSKAYYNARIEYTRMLILLGNVGYLQITTVLDY